MTHASFLSCIVNAFENRCLLIADIPAAFLLANWPLDKPDCYIRFEGAIVEMLCKIEPKYRKLIQYNKTKNGRMRKMLVGKITEAICGTLLGAILFCKKLRGVLLDMGFQTNKFDKCTFNKMLNGYQCTIQVHKDNLKLSHVEQSELNKIIDQLNEVLGRDCDNLMASYGKIYKYLGMTIDWSTVGEVVIIMYEYLEDILLKTHADFDSEEVTPAISDLFSVNPTDQKLNAATLDYFRCTVACLLYMAKRARPDLPVAVAFMCNRVKCPNIGD